MAAKATSTALALTPEIAAMWTPAQVDLIREMSAKNCTDDEFKVLLYVAHKYNLDPLTKQIYAQKYATWGDQPDKPAAIIITYAGMLEIANRGNMLDGLSSEIIYASAGNPVGARSTLWKKGCTHPFQTEVDLEEYIQRGKNKKGEPYIMGLWASKPKTMIRKVACAQNIRQAFSLGQMYIEEEMPTPQAEAQEEPAAVAVNENKGSYQYGSYPPVEAKVIEQKIPAPSPKPPTPLAPKAPSLHVDEKERLKRIADAAAIDFSFNVQTVDNMGEFLWITIGQALGCLEKMVGTTTFAATANLIGLDGLEGEVRRRYPDTQVQPQRFAATLHFVYNWAKEQAAHQAEKEAAHAQT